MYIVTVLKGYSVIHLGALSLYTKHVEIFIPMGPPQYIMTMCQRILANYSPSQRYWQICLIFNFVLSTERNYATISNKLYINSSGARSQKTAPGPSGFCQSQALFLQSQEQFQILVFFLYTYFQ